MTKTAASALAFQLDHGFEKVKIAGALPSDALDPVMCNVAAPELFIVMKGQALGRSKPKHAYDIEFVIANYSDGITKLVAEFQKIIDIPLVRDSLGRISSKFESVDRTGPVHVVGFLQTEDSEEQVIRKRRAFETVTELLDLLQIEKVV